MTHMAHQACVPPFVCRIRTVWPREGTPWVLDPFKHNSGFGAVTLSFTHAILSAPDFGRARCVTYYGESLLNGKSS